MHSEQIPAEERTRAFRRVARFVHPDKCPHPFAKEAFQKLLSSSRRMNSRTKSLSIFSSIVIQLIKLGTAEQARVLRQAFAF